MPLSGGVNCSIRSQPSTLCKMSSAVENFLKEHFVEVSLHYAMPDACGQTMRRHYLEILSGYFNRRIPRDAKVFEIGCGSGELLDYLQTPNVAGCDLCKEQVERARTRLPRGHFYHQAGELLNVPEKYDVILVSDTINQAADVQELLIKAHGIAGPRSRLILNFYSSAWRPLLSLAEFLRLRRPAPKTNWLAQDDVKNLLELSGWQVVEMEPKILCPVKIPLLSAFLNRWLAPLLPWLCLTVICVARPAPRRGEHSAEVSVVIPARNEAGNIEAAVMRIPEMGKNQEIIFVEGNSTDDTWQEIQRVKDRHPHRSIKIMQQSGKGKGDAVRCGFAAAEGSIFMILDADLTMPPEELPKFYNALLSGHAELANGVRLVYPMDKKAMRFLNLCANKFFSIAFSWVLGQPVKDTLCGTKVLWRDDYERIAANRSYFGDFDPFGDFDLLFGADRLGLKIVDIPIRYRERTYGTTNIQRWRHGALLFRMLGFAASKLKFV
jgi:SAM-dependent methyltransferase